MATETHPSSSSSDNYDVFLSFRGEDTRGNFTDHLYSALVHAGIRTFRDSEELHHGEEIGPKLLKSIEQSMISIPIFSKNYASSKWCLQELTKIMECKKTCGQIVLPIFYKVEPTHVRKQTGCFEEAFLKHEKEQCEETVRAWRQALEEAGNLKGWDSEDPDYRYETNLINSVVERALSVLSIKTNLQVAEHPTGIDSHVKEVERMLDFQSEGVQFVGIHGMGGIGKTTTAKAVFNTISNQFKISRFLEDVREKASQYQGLVNLQKELVSDLFKGKNPNIHSVSSGIDEIKKLFCNKKVLIVLDDVDQDEQLRALAGKHDWFGPGSRIIITTQDEHILRVDQVDKSKIYKPKELDGILSLQLFSKHAFGRDQPPQEFMDLSKKVVSILGGLPLAIEVVGSLLRGEKEHMVWEDTLKKLEGSPQKKVQEQLKISYTRLDLYDQKLFLDIACFFIGVDRESVIPAWQACGYFPRQGIKVLVDKSLVKIDNDNKLRMHDQLRDMGREIVRQENPEKPGERSRLWSHKEALEVLKEYKGTRIVEGLFLDFGYQEKNHQIDFDSEAENYSTGSYDEEENYLIDCDHEAENVKLPQIDPADLLTKAFEKMSDLRLLQVDRADHDGNKFGHLPQGLKWLSLKGISCKCVPTISHVKKLAVLDLSSSNITDGWNGWKQIQLIRTLKVLDLSSCYFLERTPHFSRHTGLERLILDRCTSLVAFHESIGHLHKLVFLSLKHCENLMELPNSICKLSSIRSLILSDCCRLKKLPKEMGNMESLTELIIDHTSIEEIPDSIGLLEKLERLSASGCRSLVKLPHSMGTMKSLTELIIDGTAIEELPDAIGSLEKLERLSARECGNLTELPDSICKLSSIKSLILSKCFKLEKLPKELGNMESLTELIIDQTRIEEISDSIGLLEKLERLSARECMSLVKLPHSMGTMESLTELIIDETSIEEIPDSIGLLKKLERLSARHCRNLTELPDSICKMSSIRSLILSGCKNLEKLPKELGNMESLTELIIDSTDIEEIPDSIGLLEKLERLNAWECRRLVKLPHSKGTMESLTVLIIDGTRIEEIPDSIGLSEKLKILSARDCSRLEKLPNLSKLRSLQAVWLSDCPELFEIQGISGLSLLQQLDLRNCRTLKLLPELPPSLIRLDVSRCISMERLPNLSTLKSLKEFGLDQCDKLAKIEGIDGLTLLQKLDLTNCKNLQSLPKLPSSLIKLNATDCSSIERLTNLSNLKKLQALLLYGCEKLSEIQGISDLPLLQQLDLQRCITLQSLPELPPSLIRLDVRKCISLKRLPNLSNLKILQVFHLCCSNLSEIQDISGLSVLQELDLKDCKMLQSLPGLPPSLKVLRLDNCKNLANIQSINDLTLLQELCLIDCSKLQSLSELPSSLTELGVYCCENLFEIQGINDLTLLENLTLHSCQELQSLDLSNLRILESLSLVGCYDLAEIRGLESLESLIDLEVCVCPTYIETVQKSVSQGMLPTPAFNEGNKSKSYLIPDDDNIKGTIFYFVYQLLPDPAPSGPFDPDDFFSIEAEIQRNDGKKTIKCSHNLIVEGMNANTEEDQFYSCYFQGLTWFGFPLKKRDKIYVRYASFQKEEVQLKMYDLVMEYEAMEDSQQLEKRVVPLITSRTKKRPREYDDAGPSNWDYN